MSEHETMPLEDPGFLTQSEVERLLRTDRSTLWAWRRRREDPLPAFKFNRGKVLFRREEVLAWAFRQKEQPPPPPRPRGRPRKLGAGAR